MEPRTSESHSYSEIRTARQLIGHYEEAPSFLPPTCLQLVLGLVLQNPLENGSIWEIPFPRRSNQLFEKSKLNPPTDSYGSFTAV